MMCTVRQIQILELIIRHISGITGQAIAESLKVTDRTIRNEIKIINQLLNVHHCAIQSSKVIGYYIEGKDFQTIFDLIDNYQPKENYQRTLKLLGKLIFEQPASIGVLTDSFYWSESTIYKDLTFLKALFIQKTGESFFEIMHTDQIRYHTEKDIRRNIYQFIKTKFMNQLQDDLYLIFDDYHDEHIYQLSQSLLRQSLLLNKKTIPDRRFNFLLWLIYFTALKKQYGMSLDTCLIDQFDESLYYLFSPIEAQKLINQNDLLFLIDYLKHDQDNLEDTKRILVLLEKFNQCIKYRYHIDLKQNELLFKQIKEHFIEAYKRFVHHTPIINPMIKEIKSRYLFAYEISLNIVPLWKEEFNYDINDAEVCYLAMYVEQIIVMKNQKVKIVMIETPYQSLQNYLLSWIQSNLKDEYDELLVIPGYLIEEISNQIQIDLIICFHDLGKQLSQPIYRISALPNHQDQMQLKQLIYRIRQGSNYSHMIKKLFSVENMFIESFASIEEGISFLVNSMFNIKDFDTEQIKQDIMYKENRYPSIVNSWMMMPHHFKSMNLNSTVGVLYLKEPILYQQSLIYFIFLLDLKEVFSHDEILFFEFLKQFNKQTNILNRFDTINIKEDLYQEFIYLSKVIEL